MKTIPRHQNKPLHLCVSNDGFRLLLTELLIEWGFHVNPDLPNDPEVLLLTDESRQPAHAHHNTLVLTHSSYSGTDRLSLPLPPEELWSTLEKQFHRPARSHLRIPVTHPVSVHLRGVKTPAQIVSLSPVGARLPLQRELAFGEEFAMVLPLTHHVLHLQARVIYVTPLPAVENRYETGVIFSQLNTSTKQILHDHIILECLNRVRPRLPGWAFEIGLSYLQLAAGVRDRL